MSSGLEWVQSGGRHELRARVSAARRAELERELELERRDRRRCPGCDGELDEWAIGCEQCAQRHRRRVRFGYRGARPLLVAERTLDQVTMYSDAHGGGRGARAYLSEWLDARQANPDRRWLSHVADLERLRAARRARA